MTRTSTSRRAFIAVVVLSVSISLSGGCSRTPPKPVHKPASRPRVAIDRDFAAKLIPTADPLVFVLKIEKVNPKVDKYIDGLSINVDFVLRDKTGRAVSRNDLARYAEELGDAFFNIRGTGVTSISDRFRLLTRRTPPGTYWVEPQVELSEGGKDAVWGPDPRRADLGEVPIPAANRLKVVIKTR